MGFLTGAAGGAFWQISGRTLGKSEPDFRRDLRRDLGDGALGSERRAAPPDRLRLLDIFSFGLNRLHRHSSRPAPTARTTGNSENVRITRPANEEAEVTQRGRTGTPGVPGSSPAFKSTDLKQRRGPGARWRHQRAPHPEETWQRRIIGAAWAEAGITTAGFVMGLCKCPKRKVTNLFCFEHRVNVCEHCLVANHAKCIVQSYLQWLQDSDYNPNCRLCNTSLASQETTRLVCYDLFHWACLNERAAQLPRNTAPAGYQCPSCNGPIFPPTNLAGPVASALREKLATVNWARAGLGLPLIDEVMSPEPEPLNSSSFSDWSNFNATDSPEQEKTESASASTVFYSQAPQPPSSPSPPDQHTIIHMGSSETSTHAPRKVYDTRDDGRAPGLHGDYDDDKYRRRPALGWLAQLLRSRAGSRKRPLTLLQRAGLLLLLGLLGFLALLALMSRLGRAAADSDPNLDPLMNPHIRVGPS